MSRGSGHLDDLAAETHEEQRRIFDRVETIGTPSKGWRDDFLAALEAKGNVTVAVAAAGVGRATAYRERDNDPDFAAAWAAAREAARKSRVEILEDAAMARATEGWDEPVFYEGVLVGYKRKFSDTLLIFLLKGESPEKYRDNATLDVNHSGLEGTLAGLVRNSAERRAAEDDE